MPHRFLFLSSKFRKSISDLSEISFETLHVESIGRCLPPLGSFSLCFRDRSLLPSAKRFGFRGLGQNMEKTLSGVNRFPSEASLPTHWDRMSKQFTLQHLAVAQIDIHIHELQS